MLTLDGLRARWGDWTLAADLTIGTGEHIAVTGPNGSGKTTLMLLLTGREPTSGSIERPGGIGRPRSNPSIPRRMSVSLPARSRVSVGPVATVGTLTRPSAMSATA